ncbi:hypothetical protein EC957_010442 [Mortierella hygrophila]|uniref:Uncharacterized protein n=1 Tax=Mortierella hygrophila TaxID=979708 RepID=A0A9P6K4D9_9FUNG|nr:hypothetical protein EC957_010442 [Mortierella hygrophila]
MIGEYPTPRSLWEAKKARKEALDILFYNDCSYYGLRATIKGLDPKVTGTDAEKDQDDLKESPVAPDNFPTPQTFVHHIISSVINWLSRGGPMDVRAKKAEHEIVKEDGDVTLDGCTKLDIFLEKSLSQKVASPPHSAPHLYSLPKQALPSRHFAYSTPVYRAGGSRFRFPEKWTWYDNRKMTLESKLAWQERKKQLLSDTTAMATEETVFIDRKVALAESILTAVQVYSDRITALNFPEASIPIDEVIALATNDPDIVARGEVQHAIVDTFTKTAVPDADDCTESDESDEDFQYMVEDIVAAIEGNSPVQDGQGATETPLPTPPSTPIAPTKSIMARNLRLSPAPLSTSNSTATGAKRTYTPLVPSTSATRPTASGVALISNRRTSSNLHIKFAFPATSTIAQLSMPTVMATTCDKISKTSPLTTAPPSATLSTNFTFVASASSTPAIAATAPVIESAASTSSSIFPTVASRDFPDFNPSFKFPMPTLPTAVASSVTGS